MASAKALAEATSSRAGAKAARAVPGVAGATCALVLNLSPRREGVVDGWMAGAEATLVHALRALKGLTAGNQAGKAR